MEEEGKKRVRASEQEGKRDANARIKWNKACAKSFKLAGKKAEEWIERWISVLDSEYEDGATVEEVVDLLN